LNRKIYEVCVPFLFLMFLGRAFALNEPMPPPIVNIDLGIISEAINQMFTGLTQSLTELPAAVVNQFLASLQSLTANFLTTLLLIAKEFITTNPDIAPMFPLWQTIVYIISLFYLILFLIVGFFFLFSSIDAEKRTSAKKWFKSTIIMIAAVGASFQLYEIFLAIGAGVATYLWASEFEVLFQASELTALNLILLTVYSGAVLAAFITLFIRHLFLVMGAAIFPIALFFYFIEPLKPWGKMLLEILFAAVLMQIIDVIIFIGSQIVWEQFIGLPDIAGWAPTMAFGLVAIINTIIIAFAVIKASKTVTQQLPEVVAVAKMAGTAAIGAIA